MVLTGLEYSNVCVAHSLGLSFFTGNATSSHHLWDISSAEILWCCFQGISSPRKQKRHKGDHKTGWIWTVWRVTTLIWQERPTVGCYGVKPRSHCGEVSLVFSLVLPQKEEEGSDVASQPAFLEKGNRASESSGLLCAHFQSWELPRSLAEASPGSLQPPGTQTGHLAS